MTEPNLFPQVTLSNVRLGFSVSDSADLSRLGLSKEHAHMAVGEIARTVLIAGGRLVYGGRVKPSGFTRYLMHEVRRYGGESEALTLCLAEPEHRRLSRAELNDVDRQIGTMGQVICLDESGSPLEDVLASKPSEPAPVESQESAQSAYTSLRRFMGGITDARVLIGGQLGSFKGTMPGIIEEAIIAVRRCQPLYVSAGFGGASALVAKALDIDDLGWAPSDFPSRPEDVRIDDALDELREAADEAGWDLTRCGLGDSEREQLAASHRASEIASLVAIGLARSTA